MTDTISLASPVTPQPLARQWREAFARLSATSPPCPGIRPNEWPQMHTIALQFLFEHADRAAELRWTTEELFGVDRVHGAIRADVCGAFTFSNKTPALGVEVGHIDFGVTKFYRSPHRPPSISVWDWREPKW